MCIPRLVLSLLVLPLAFASCANIRPDGALATLAGRKPPMVKTYENRNHIRPTTPSGQVRWAVDF